MATDYTVFKGLQKPLEFMGFRGRFLYIAAASFGGAFCIYAIMSILTNLWIAAGLSAICAVGGIIAIHVKQKKGLHAKKRDKGVFMYRSLFIK